MAQHHPGGSASSSACSSTGSLTATRFINRATQEMQIEFALAAGGS
jgi:hypothetical protein